MRLLRLENMLKNILLLNSKLLIWTYLLLLGLSKLLNLSSTIPIAEWSQNIGRAKDNQYFNRRRKDVYLKNKIFIPAEHWKILNKNKKDIPDDYQRELITNL